MESDAGLVGTVLGAVGNYTLRFPDGYRWVGWWFLVIGIVFLLAGAHNAAACGE